MGRVKSTVLHLWSPAYILPSHIDEPSVFFVGLIHMQSRRLSTSRFLGAGAFSGVIQKARCLLAGLAAVARICQTHIEQQSFRTPLLQPMRQDQPSLAIDLEEPPLALAATSPCVHSCYRTHTLTEPNA